MSNKTIGDQGEELACKYLKRQGYKILERNFRIRGGEIDAIAKDQGDLVFVEVKTRHSHEFGVPVESVTPWKINFLIRASHFYLAQKKLLDKPYRIDVVSVDLTNGQNIELIKNITG